MADMPEQEAHDNNPGRWLSTNLVGVPSWQIASLAFNEQPQRLRISGAKENHSGLFHLLETAEHPQDAAEKFRSYMNMVFQLKPSRYEREHAEIRRFRPSYLKLMEGWGFDSNSPQGAVLKGWAQSRFGLPPTYHKEPLLRYPSDAWNTFQEEKYASRFHSASIYQQLDLLYEYCQFVIHHYGLFGPRNDDPWVTLWRGVNRYDEPNLEKLNPEKHFTNHHLQTAETNPSPKTSTPDAVPMYLNNLVSFTTSRERADEFGDWILEVRVPKVKLLFFPGLLHNQALSGEGEVIALGGLYNVKANYV